MGQDAIVILEGGRRLPRADLLVNNREPGLFSRFSTTQLGGLAIRAAVAGSRVPVDRVGHVVMGMAQHSHRDSIYAAQGMRWRGGLPHDVPALTVARICGSGAEALVVGAEIITAGLRHDPDRPFIVVGGAESMQYPFTLWGMRGRKVGAAVQKYGPLEARSLPSGTHLTDLLLACLYDPSARMSMANTAEELARRYRITREEADAFGLRSHHNARRARDAGWFDEEIAPVTVQRDGAADPVTVRHDTHILEEASLEGMARLPPAFEPGGIVTAGNASAVVDGAAAMVIGRESDAARRGPEAAGPGGRRRRGRLRPGDHGVGPGPGHPARPGAGRDPRRRRRPWWSSTRPSRRRRWPASRTSPGWASTRSGSTPWAAPSPWGTRSAPPAPS